MDIHNFDFFEIGTVFNPIELLENVSLKYQKITILYPARLNAMAIDPSKIVTNNNMKYMPGEIVFSTQIFVEITVEAISEDVVIVNGEAMDRESVIKHSCYIMKKALGYNGGFKVQVDNFHNLKHCGLGSTGCLQAGVAAAINHLFGLPITREKLIKYLAQNYGEEIDEEPQKLNPVQCIGGSAASGLYKGGVLVLAGENTVIATGSISEEYDIIIGIPEDYEFIDSKNQFEEEKANLGNFLECGSIYRNEIAYNILHHFLPAIYHQDLKTMGDVIWDYRHDKGSIKNCSYTYSELPQIMSKLAYLKKDNLAEILSISSVGPAIFAITKNTDECIKAFKQNSVKSILTKINNDSYRVINLE